MRIRGLLIPGTNAQDDFCLNLSRLSGWLCANVIYPSFTCSSFCLPLPGVSFQSDDQLIVVMIIRQAPNWYEYEYDTDDLLSNQCAPHDLGAPNQPLDPFVGLSVPVSVRLSGRSTSTKVVSTN